MDPLLFAGISCSTSARVCLPDLSMSARVMIWTGAGVSVSTRLMFVPVTSIFSSLVGSSAKAMKLSVKQRAAPKINTANLWFFII
jgi:hypothetical protein